MDADLNALLILTMVITPSEPGRPWLEVDSRGFDRLIGTRHATLEALVHAVTADLNDRPLVCAYYLLMGRHFRVQIRADGSSSGPIEVAPAGRST